MKYKCSKCSEIRGFIFVYNNLNYCSQCAGLIIYALAEDGILNVSEEDKLSKLIISNKNVKNEKKME